MHPDTALMLARSIEQDRLDTATRRRSQRPERQHRGEPRSSHWDEMVSGYRLGFATTA